MVKKIINAILVSMLMMTLFGCSKKEQKTATYEDYYELGMLSYENSDYEAAVAAFEQALELEITEDAVVEMLRAYIATGADSLSIMNKMEELGAKYSGRVPSFKSLYDRMFELVNAAIRFEKANVYLKDTDARYLGIPVNELTINQVGSSVPCDLPVSGGVISAIHKYGRNQEGVEMHYVIAEKFSDSPYSIDTIALTPDCFEGVSVDGFNFGDSKKEVLKKIADADYLTLEGINYCTYCDDDATVTISSGKGHYMGRLNDQVGYSEEEANAGSYYLAFVYNHNVSELELYPDRVESSANLIIGFYFDDNDVLVAYDEFTYRSDHSINVYK